MVFNFMPEMPEVETIARKLRRSLVGKSVRRIQLSGLSLRRPVAASFAEILSGRRISGIRRRGKYLVIELEPRAYLLIHLGMSGRVFHRRGADEVSRHTHALLGLSDGSVLEYRDPRRFGLLAALATGLCLAIPTAAAADQSVTKTPPAKKAKVKGKAAKAKPEKTERMVVTGSSFPQEIRPGGISPTAVPVDIVTSDQIRRMGATSVSFVLSRQPGFR